MHWKLLYKSKYKGVEFLPQNLNTFLYIFQTMNSFKLNNQSLKYQRFTRSDCIDIGLRKLEFVAKTQFLWTTIWRQLKNCVKVKIIQEKRMWSKKLQYFIILLKGISD